MFALSSGQNAVTSPSIGWGRFAIWGSEGALDLVPGRGLEISSRSAMAGALGFDNGMLTVSAGGPGDMPGVIGPHVSIQESHVYADILHLAECVIDDRTPLVTGEHARHVVEIIEKGYLASSTGQAQEIVSSF